MHATPAPSVNVFDAEFRSIGNFVKRTDNVVGRGAVPLPDADFARIRSLTEAGSLSDASPGGGREDRSSVRADYVGAPTEEQFRVIEAVGAVAAEIGASPAAVALAWLRTRPGTVVPIVGARRLHHLQDNLTALDLTLDAPVHQK